MRLTNQQVIALATTLYSDACSIVKEKRSKEAEALTAELIKSAKRFSLPKDCVSFNIKEDGNLIVFQKVDGVFIPNPHHVSCLIPTVKWISFEEIKNMIIVATISASDVAEIIASIKDQYGL